MKVLGNLDGHSRETQLDCRAQSRANLSRDLKCFIPSAGFSFSFAASVVVFSVSSLTSFGSADIVNGMMVFLSVWTLNCSDSDITSE